MGYDVSLRRSEADLIEVVRGIDHTEEDDENRFSAAAQPKHNTEEVRRKVDTHGHTINAVLIGNPNCGKTSLFNSLCHTNEHVGNYSGVTVDADVQPSDTVAILSISLTFGHLFADRIFTRGALCPSLPA